MSTTVTGEIQAYGRDFRSWAAAVVTGVVLFGLIAAANDAREEALRRHRAELHGSRYLLTSSADGSISAYRVGHHGLVCTTRTGVDVLAVDLAYRNYDDLLYAHNALGSRLLKPEWQRWSASAGSWMQVPGETRSEAYAKTINGLGPLFVAALVIVGGIYGMGCLPRWVRGVLWSFVAAIAVSCAASLFEVQGSYSGSVTAVAFTADGSRLATADAIRSDTVVSVWDIQSGRGVAKFDLQERYASELTFSDDDTRLIGTDSNGERHTWKLAE
jgi:WD40 repeat protein